VVWGWYISAAAHVALLLAVLFGGMLSRPPEAPVSVADVTVLSEAEFAALILRNPSPDVAEEPSAPPPPAPEDAPPAPAPDTPAPQITESPAPRAETPEAAPEVTIPEPTPEASVEDEPPVVTAPEPLPDGPRFETPPDRAPRVAPTPAPPPPVTAETAPDAAPEIAPAPDAPPERVAEETPETAPEEAAEELRTEADDPERSLAVATSPRPRARPDQPAPRPEPAEEPTETAATAPERPAPATDDAVAEALAAADAPRGDPGPPLTGAERDNLRVAVRDCWNVGSLSTAAKETIVTVFVSLDRDGRPDTGTIRMIGYSNGTDATARQAYEAARRAIIRCGSRGFPLPVEKYEQWREIEMTFNLDGVSF